MKILKFFLSLVVLAAVLVLSKNWIAKAAIETGVRIATGSPLHIQDLDFSLLKGYVGIKGLQLFNPDGYSDKIMADVPEIFVDLDPQSLPQGKIHLEQMRFYMKEFVVVKNKNGALNLDAFKPVQAQKSAKQQAPTQAKGKAPKLQLDRLDLKVEKVIFKDYSAGGEPKVTEFNIGLDEHHENIMSLQLLIGLIVSKTLMRTTIASLANFDVSALSDSVTNSLNQMRALTPEFASKATDMINQKMGQAPELAKETTGALKDKAENLKGRLQKIF